MSTTATIPHTQHAGEIERYTFTERIMHWFTGVTYLYCLATGLAFYSPHLFWLAYMLGGAPTSRFWHPIVAIGFVIGTFWMNSLWRRDMDITAVDKRWLDHTEAYITNDEEHTPLSDRFNGGQKLFYWADALRGIAAFVVGPVFVVSRVHPAPVRMGARCDDPAA